MASPNTWEATPNHVSPSGPQRSHRRWWALGVIGMIQLLIVTDATVMNIALPSAQTDLGLGDGERHWVITAYVLFFGGALLLGGRIGDRYGTRKVLLGGLVGFGMSSLLAGAAPTGDVLFAARAVQGLTAALVAPAALSLLSSTFPEARERGIAFGVYGAFSSAGAAIGLILGGVLTEYVDWRWCLYVNVPFALVAALGARMTMRPAAPRTGRLDVAGAVLSMLGLAAVVLGFAQAESQGWTNPIVIGLLTSGLVLLSLLIRVESNVERPLLPLRILLDRTRGGSFLAVALSQIALFGFFLAITYYMQTILDYSPVQAGLAFLPLTAAIALGAGVLAARLMPRIGPRGLISSGLLLAAAGMGALTQLAIGVDAVYPTLLLPAQIAIGLGIGLVMMPAMSAATTGVELGDMGIASAAVNASQQVGGAMGAALLNTIAATVTAGYLANQTAPDPLEAALAGFISGIAAGAAILAATAVVVFALIPRRSNPAVLSANSWTR